MQTAQTVVHLHQDPNMEFAVLHLFFLLACELGRHLVGVALRSPERPAELDGADLTDEARERAIENITRRLLGGFRLTIARVPDVGS